MCIQWCCCADNGHLKTTYEQLTNHCSYYLQLQIRSFTLLNISLLDDLPKFIHWLYILAQLYIAHNMGVYQFTFSKYSIFIYMGKTNTVIIYIG